jgi:hypothetical protein
MGKSQEKFKHYNDLWVFYFAENRWEKVRCREALSEDSVRHGKWLIWCTLICLLRPPELLSHLQVDAKDAPTPRSGHRMVIAGIIQL